MSPRPQRPDRPTLPGIADIRIVADEATTEIVLDVLRAEFTITTPRPYSGGRSYLQLDTGSTAPDTDRARAPLAVREDQPHE